MSGCAWVALSVVELWQLAYSLGHRMLKHIAGAYTELMSCAPAVSLSLPAPQPPCMQACRHGLRQCLSCHMIAHSAC